VDFVVKEGRAIVQLIQVSYAGDRKDLPARELKSLLKASADLKCRSLLVITWDLDGEERMDGRKIVYMPLWKWLLEPHIDKNKGPG